jgi:hypothetical protein
MLAWAILAHALTYPGANQSRRSTSGGCANRPSVLAKCAARSSFPTRGRNGNAQFRGDKPSCLLALRRDSPHRSPRLFQDRGWRCLGRAAVEGRLWRIDHVKLNGLCGLVATQFGRQAQSAVDTGRNARGKDPGAINDHTFVDGDRSEVLAKGETKPSVSSRGAL